MRALFEVRSRTLLVAQLAAFAACGNAQERIRTAARAGIRRMESTSGGHATGQGRPEGRAEPRQLTGLVYGGKAELAEKRRRLLADLTPEEEPVIAHRLIEPQQDEPLFL